MSVSVQTLERESGVQIKANEQLGLYGGLVMAYRRRQCCSAIIVIMSKLHRYKILVFGSAPVRLVVRKREGLNEFL